MCRNSKQLDNYTIIFLLRNNYSYDNAIIIYFYCLIV